MKDLVGRSKNERKLDGIYNRQIKDLIINKHKSEKRNSDIFLNLSKRSNNEDIPFPEIYEKGKKQKYMDSIKGNVEKNKKLEKNKILEKKDNIDVILEGDKEKNTEEENACHNDNINNTTSSNNNSVVTIYKDNRFIINYTYEQNEHTEKENLQESLIGDENITHLKKQNIQKKQHRSTNDDLCEKENTPHYTIVHITKEEKQFLKALKIKVYYIIILFKLNDNFIFNKLIGIYRQIFEEIQKEYNLYEHKEIINDETIQNNNSNNDNNNNNNKNNQDNINDNDEIIKNYFLFLKDKWILPNEYQIFKMKRKAFVKCLSNLYHFINIKWAKTSVESLLHDVYIKKFMFETCDEIIIENIQSSIKTNLNKRASKFESSHVLSIGESLNPVVDARDEKIVSIHGSHVWSNKQMDR